MGISPTTSGHQASSINAKPGRNQQAFPSQDIPAPASGHNRRNSGSINRQETTTGSKPNDQKPGEKSGRDQKADAKNPETSTNQQDVADVDRRIAGIDDALSQTRHPMAEKKLRSERQALDGERQQLLLNARSEDKPETPKASANGTSKSHIADSEYAVGSDVQRQELENKADKAIAKLDQKISALEERRQELKTKIEGASGQEMPALVQEHREVQIEAKTLKTQRAEIRTMRELPNAPDAMAIAADVYEGRGESTLKNTHLVQMTDSELKKAGISPDLLGNESIGFHAEIYRNTNTGEVVLAFEGTTFTSLQDWKANILQGFGYSTDQYDQAARVAELFNKGFPNDKKVITGHSLGGGLAAYGGLATKNEDIKIITFNGAGLNDKTLAQADVSRADAEKIVTNFNLDGELLTTLQEGKLVSPVLSALPAIGIGNIALGRVMPDAVGQNYDIDAFDEKGESVGLIQRIFGHKSGELHGTDALKNSVQEEMNQSMKTMDDVIDPK